MNKQTKTILLNVGCGLLAFLFLFFLLFALQLDSKVLAVVVFLLFLAVCGVWVYGNLEMRKEETAVQKVPDLTTPEDISRAFAGLVPKVFRKEIAQCEAQLARMEEKKTAMDKILKESFGDSVITYNKFMKGIGQAEALFLDNQRQIIRRILLFDQEGWQKAKANGTLSESGESAIRFVQGKIAENEEILEKTDALAARIADLHTPGQLEDKSVVRQLEELSEQTVYYKDKVQ